jgi:hypothetical protein
VNKYEFSQYLVAPGEALDLPEEAWIVSAEVEEGGKIRVVVAVLLETGPVVF